jgi:hypothetical protein
MSGFSAEKEGNEGKSNSRERHDRVLEKWW